MLRNRLTKCATVYLVAVAFFTCFLAWTEASRLTKTERRDGRKEATWTPSSIREGVIVFGSKTVNASVGDAAYQADSPVWPKGRVDLVSKEAQWKRMSPSLLCGMDQMKFRAVGSPVKFISLDQEPPSTCGHIIQRTPFGLVMYVPYDGCNVIHEHGNYDLPLHWQGIPLTLRCPKPTPPAAQPLDPQMFPGGILPPWLMPNPQDPAPTTPAPQNGPIYPYWYYWNQLQYQPEDPTTTAPPQDQMPYGPIYPYWYYWNQLQYQPEDPTTTAPPQDPVVPQMPQGLYPPFMYYWHHRRPHHRKPKEPATPTAFPSVPQIPPASYFGSQFMYPWYNYAPTTAPPAANGQFAWYAQGANMPWWFPTAAPIKKARHHQAQVHYRPPIEVSYLQQPFSSMHESE